MLHFLRIGATLLTLAPLVVFADAFGVRGRGWVVARHGARLALFALELALVAAWVTARWGLSLDRVLVPEAAAALAAVAGALLSLAGSGLGVWSRRRLGRLFSPTFGLLPGHALVTDGPYGVTRHPLYTGVLAIFAGQALLWNSALTLALAVALMVPLFIHTVIEDRMFAAEFGAAFADYRARVPRLLPRWRWAPERKPVRNG